MEKLNTSILVGVALDMINDREGRLFLAQRAEVAIQVVTIRGKKYELGLTLELIEDEKTKS